MKFKLLYPALVFMAMLVFVPQAEALPTSSTTAPTEVQEQNFADNFKTFLEKRKIKRNEKIKAFLLKANKVITKAAKAMDVDLDDPVMKWLWYGIFAFGAAVILWILGGLLFGPLVWLGSLASLLSSVCLVIWLLKYLELA